MQLWDTLQKPKHTPASRWSSARPLERLGWVFTVTLYILWVQKIYLQAFLAADRSPLVYISCFIMQFRNQSPYIPRIYDSTNVLITHVTLYVLSKIL